MSKTRKEEHRIRITWGCALLVLLVLMVSESRWERIPILEESLFLIGCLLTGLGAMGRAWCSIFIAGRKDGVLVTQGPYAMCRNPLYFFSMLGAFGIGFATETFTMPIVVLLAFMIYYPRIIHEEEKRLKGLFGADYENYSHSVPCFFPKISLLKGAEPDEYPVSTRIVRHCLFEALWFVWIMGFIELIAAFHEVGVLKPLFVLY